MGEFTFGDVYFQLGEVCFCPAGGSGSKPALARFCRVEVVCAEDSCFVEVDEYPQVVRYDWCVPGEDANSFYAVCNTG